MENSSGSNHGVLDFRTLYPSLSDSELKEAEANIRRYLVLTQQVMNELQPDGAFDNPAGLRMLEERSNADFTT